MCHAVLYKGDTQLCQTSVSFLLAPSNTQACAVDGPNTLPQYDSSPGATYFSPQNTIAVNPDASQSAVQSTIQVQFLKSS